MSVQIEFDDEKLRRIRERLRSMERPKGARAAMSRAVLMIQGDMAKYPPATAANQPGRARTDANGRTRRMGHYVRGEGWVTPGGRRLGNSENLGRRWTTRVEGHGAVGVVGNNASYVRWVHDEAKQARFHKKRGWHTVQDVIEKRRGRLRDILMEPWREALTDG